MLAVAAILAIAALMALMTRGMVAPADTGGMGAQDAKAGIMHASMVKDMGQMRGTGAAVIHDDAGNAR